MFLSSDDALVDDPLAGKNVETASPLDPSAPEYFPTAGPRSSCDAPSTMRTPSPRGSPMGARKEQCAFDDVGSDFLAQQLATAQEQIAQLTIANKVLREQTGGPGVPQAQELDAYQHRAVAVPPRPYGHPCMAAAAPGSPTLPINPPPSLYMRTGLGALPRPPQPPPPPPPSAPSAPLGPLPAGAPPRATPFQKGMPYSAECQVHSLAQQLHTAHQRISELMGSQQKMEGGEKVLMVRRIAMLEAQLAAQCADSGHNAHTAYNLQLKLTHANNKMKAAEHAHRKELRAAQAAVAAQKQEIAELRRNLSAAEAAGKMSQQLQFVASQVWGCGGGAAVSAQ